MKFDVFKFCKNASQCIHDHNRIPSFEECLSCELESIRVLVEQIYEKIEELK